jgi:formylglycine-generating enzyme required for sulfatase activity
MRNPYLLGLLCQLDQAWEDLNLHGILDAYVTHATRDLDRRRGIVLRQTLRALAFRMCKEKVSACAVQESDRADALEDAVQLEFLRPRGPDERVEFAHDHLRDYFAAEHVAEQGLPLLTGQLGKWPDEWELWGNVLRILAGRKPPGELTDLFEQAPTGLDSLWVSCLCEASPDQLSPGSREFLRRRRETLEKGVSQLRDVADRGRVGRELAPILQQARELAHLDPRVAGGEPDLVEVPADRSAAGFKIGKYPVTNLEFARFVWAGGPRGARKSGYDEDALWLPWAQKWRREGGIDRPRFWDDADLNQPNAPVVGVSFHEALAYCRWLSQLHGRRFTLPTAEQWERAACIPDVVGQLLGELAGELSRSAGEEPPREEERTRRDALPEISRRLAQLPAEYFRKYYQQLAYGKRAPVGLFPANPLGCFDLFGNVWQWCDTWMTSNRPDAAPSRDDQPHPVMVKGGPATGEIDVFSLAWGGWFDPYTRFERLGFRVCWTAEAEEARGQERRHE